MKKINSLKLEALKKNHYVAFMRFVNSIVPNYPILSQWMPYFVNRFQADYALLDEVYLKYDIDACTQAVQDADKERDRAFRHLKDLVTLAITYPESDAKKQAGETIMRVIELYGGYRIPNQGITAESATISNLVEDFETKYPDEVETLDLSQKVQALKEAQALFDEKYLARDLCEADFVKGEMTDARRKLDESYRLLVDAINLKVYEDAEGELDAFINLMNVEIGKNRTYTGQGQVGSTTGSGTGSEDEDGMRVKNATFDFRNGDQVKLRVEVGTVLAAPSNTEGYMWKPEVPELMPAKNLTFREVPIEEREATATFHFFDHTEEEIRQVVGSALTAPANTEGYYWDPAVPATMPEEDTSYYELPVEQEEGGEGQEEEEYTVTYHNDNGEVITTQRYKVGQTIVPPTPPAGFEWGYLPNIMPARDLNIYPIDPETGA